jgi:hypothetical protein
MGASPTTYRALAAWGIPEWVVAGASCTAMVTPIQGEHSMNQKTFSFVASVIFLLVALGHVLRLAFGWHAVVNMWAVPMWVSWVALLIAGFLAFEGFRLSMRP